MENKNVILSQEVIAQKIIRIAYEIYEHNSAEKGIVLAGIWDRGSIIARKIADQLKEISDIDVELIELKLNKENPSQVDISKEMDFTGKVIVVVDDVANSGRTMLYALKPFLNNLPRKIQTAVLVDRKHKSFPLSVDFVGYSLATTLQEMVMVDTNGEEIVSAYLV
ncbi:phosphoribosyltransferase [Chitinophaga caeni]|uniref:Phosphoribosyltransferase n=1 Tax=Chitinophaga caeni TaxID=2029983 RepID=A0A291R154_9BACT|nr:phosphoribosyltransferase family protein [Chitinophaga caeni]ATL49872.1 phosphoribosyltransferase [Chitinophaga caeni]